LAAAPCGGGQYPVAVRRVKDMLRISNAAGADKAGCGRARRHSAGTIAPDRSGLA
jgi:hypothetical protein